MTANIRDLIERVAANAAARRAAHPEVNVCDDCGVPVNGSDTVCRPCGRSRRVSSGRLAPEDAIPQRFAWAALSAPQLPGRVAPVDAARVAESFHAGTVNAVLVGPSGAGKTSLAVALLREHWHPSNRFVSVPALARARSEAALGAEPRAVSDACRARLAVLDDLGVETSKDGTVQDVIRARHDAGLRTIFTTGLDLEGLVKRYDEGIARRIFEGSVVIALGRRP